MPHSSRGVLSYKSQSNAPMTTVPYFNRTVGHLSGTEDNVFFHVSLDAKKDWSYGIFHNSRFGIFNMYPEKGKLKVELIAKGLNTEKFRKVTVKSEAHAINKILEWMGKIGGDSYFLN